MNKKIGLFLLFIIVLGVYYIFFMRQKQNNVLLKPENNTQEEIQIPYSDFLQEVNHKKKSLTSSKDAQLQLFHWIENDIAQYWIGTKWDFNGVSRKPQNGAIACGYFITHTLTDLGFKINRIKLAQDPSSEMITKLCVDIHRFSSFEKLESFLKSQPNHSVYIVGLDFHTGYILKAENNIIYFLHSSYINREGVKKEKMENSAALKVSKSFMIGNLSGNKTLIKQWINETY